MTRKLYYEDCHLARFSAGVTSCAPVHDGWEVTLDATAFYPEGGGQACDTGLLGGVRVLDVQERGEEIIHLCSGALTVGERVEGIVDFERRFDLMQQHTGEHIVSGIVHRRWGWHNTGFHVGAELVQVDFDGPIPPEALPEIEAEANRALWENITVKTFIPAPEELPGIFYRTKRELPWPVRIMQVPGYDSCACCGIHVAQTGEVGLVKIFSMVKFHQGVRMEMACGRRAMEYLNRVYQQSKVVSQTFSAPVLEIGTAAQKVNDQLEQQKIRIASLEQRVFSGIAKDYVNQRGVLHFELGLSSGGVRELADKIADHCDGTAAVFSGDDESGYSYCLVSRKEDLRPLGKEMTNRLQGRGGGKPGFQQGSVKATRTQIEEFFTERSCK